MSAKCTCRKVYSQAQGFHVPTGPLCNYCQSKRELANAAKVKPADSAREHSLSLCSIMSEMIPDKKMRADFILNHLKPCTDAERSIDGMRKEIEKFLMTL